MKKRKFPELNGPEVEWSKEEKERLLQALHEYVNVNVFAQGEGDGGGGGNLRGIDVESCSLGEDVDSIKPS